MTNMTMKKMKNTYQQLTKKEKLLARQVTGYNTLISSLLVELRGLGEKLDASFAKEIVLRIQNEKGKLEEKLVSIRIDKSVMSAKLNFTFERILESNTIEELFSSINEKYESYAIPVEFTYEYDNENDDIKNVTFFKANSKNVEFNS
ncbi:hypothetical protein [Paenibacillus radicis (ex Xue et al. 2023)]|uniref:Uncharacterized protein n=1 Tax=Paenibacillus radicis (ex Xue et al. 2023) TaxID=2972489 RepID=A0ABT1YL70_9BACL|nr:hypothetical protein [Paenibacillus radicis (ex Xue et al. 2023)]MCR8633931.1 hypothetical protein [Paenibacillus radicis (ex Xue et al. 2023)]